MVLRHGYAPFEVETRLSLYAKGFEQQDRQLNENRNAHESHMQGVVESTGGRVGLSECNGPVYVFLKGSLLKRSAHLFSPYHGAG